MPELIHYGLIVLLGYFIGSLPTAYLLVKWTTRLDIRASGSGNVGAMNAFSATNSKILGLIVMIIDAAKGVVAVLLISGIFGSEFWNTGVGGVAAIAGHNYSPWIRFRGGRGLATATGVLAVIGWFVVVIWCAAWTVNYSYSRNVHVSNVVASILTPIAVWAMPEKFLQAFCSSLNMADLLIFLTAVFSLILIRHIKPIADLWNSSHQS